MVSVASHCFAGALCVCLVLGHFVAAAPPPNNYEGLRELYQQLLEAGAAGSASEGFEQQQQLQQAAAPVGLLNLFAGGLGGGLGGAGPGVPLSNHQLVRKSNRTPSLRLRYGRRSDPAMKVRAPVSSSP